MGESPSLEMIKRHAFVLVGGLSESAAFDVESSFIKMLGGAQGNQLLNIQSGHGNQNVPQVVPLEDAQMYFDASAMQVSKVSALDLSLYSVDSSTPLTIVVKGTALAIQEPDYALTGVPGPIHNSELVEFGAEMRSLRGWNPSSPWTAEEARIRASVWWRISQENVLILQRLADRNLLHLALVVQDPRRGSSVVRYVWAVDSVGLWLRTGNQWGIPLGTELTEHSWRGHKLVRGSDGVQVLHGHSSGICFVSSLWDGALPNLAPAPAP